jgi:SAM-dependent methyltransferase
MRRVVCEIPVELLFTAQHGTPSRWADLPLARLARRLAKCRAAPEHTMSATYNPRGYFNLDAGCEVTALIGAHATRRVPVSISLEDHEHWLNRPEIARVKAALARHRRASRYPWPYSPLLHPAFSSLPCARDSTTPTRLDLILARLGARRLQGKTVLDVGSSAGFFAQHFAREGAYVTALEADASCVALCRALNWLYRTDFEIRHESFEESDVPAHDVGLLLSVFYPAARDPKRRRRFLRALDDRVRELVVFESGDDPSAEVAAITSGTHFTHYRRIATTWGTGKLRELGLFTPARRPLRTGPSRPGRPLPRPA